MNAFVSNPGRNICLFFFMLLVFAFHTHAADFVINCPIVSTTPQHLDWGSMQVDRWFVEVAPVTFAMKDFDNIVINFTCPEGKKIAVDSKSLINILYHDYSITDMTNPWDPIHSDKIIEIIGAQGECPPVSTVMSGASEYSSYGDDFFVNGSCTESIGEHWSFTGFRLTMDISAQTTSDIQEYFPCEQITFGSYIIPAIMILRLSDIDIGPFTSLTDDIVKYNLTLGVNPAEGGFISPDPGTYEYTEGEIVTVSAIPADGYSFTNWTGDVLDPDLLTTTVIMDADKTVIANFELPVEAIEYVINHIELSDIDSNIKSRLNSQLEKAIDLLQGGLIVTSQSQLNTVQSNHDGRRIAAVHRLEALIHYIQAISGKKLPADEADYIVEMIDRIIESLENPGTQNALQNSDHINPLQKMENTLTINTYPNPFNPKTTIQYHLPAPTRVSIRIFNIKGELVTTLVDAFKNEGTYVKHWDTSQMHLASGLYFCRIKTQNDYKNIRVYLVK